MPQTKTRNEQDNSKEDRSPRIHQKEKLKNKLTIRGLKWTDKQRSFLELAFDPKVEVLIIKGCAGTSKTAISIFTMLTLLSEKKVSDIVLVRSNVESADSKMGYLPGSSSDKMQPYMMPFFDKLDMFLSKQEIKNLETEERIVAQPLGFLRGLDYQVKALCLDEAQNASVKEILTFMSRIGRFCKTFICGDVEQVDIKNTGFEAVYELFDNQESRDNGIYCWEFTGEDIMRSNLCKFVTRKFRELNNKGHNIKNNFDEYSPSNKKNI